MSYKRRMRCGAPLACSLARKIVGNLALAGALLGCSSGETDGEALPSTDLRYCDVEPIFEDKCVRCHSDGGDVATPFSLERYDDVDERATAIKRAIRGTGAGSMPPVGVYDVDPDVEPLSDEERDLLSEWIAGGAPEGDDSSCD